jgi:hypothetical protein
MKTLPTFPAQTAPLAMWVIYDRPLDYPHCAVARLWHATADGRAVAKRDTIIAPNVEAVRRELPPGLFRLDRQPSDDPCIVETWL